LSKASNCAKLKVFGGQRQAPNEGTPKWGKIISEEMG